MPLIRKLETGLWEVRSHIGDGIAREMESANISQSELARHIRTSRSAVERLLDPTNPSVTLQTLERAAGAVGKRLKIQLMA